MVIIVRPNPCGPMMPLLSGAPARAIRKNWWIAKPNVISEVAVLTHDKSVRS